MKEEKVIIKIDQSAINRVKAEHESYVKVGNELLVALKKFYKEKFVAFKFSQLVEFFRGRERPDVQGFFNFLYANACQENEKWKKHVEEFGIELNPNYWRPKFFNDEIQQLIGAFTALGFRGQISYQYVVFQEDGTARLDSEGLNEYLQEKHGIVLKDPQEIKIWRQAEATAALIGEFVKQFQSGLPGDEKYVPLVGGGNHLLIPLEKLFDIDRKTGEIKPSVTAIPRLYMQAKDAFIAVAQQENPHHDIDRSNENSGGYVNFMGQQKQIDELVRF